MKTANKILITTLICSSAILGGCKKNKDKNQNTSTNSVTIKTNLDSTHYLKFFESNTEILRLVVLEGETYEDLLPYFPTLTEEPGYIKYWDGDYTYTAYSHENQFKVWDAENLQISIYAYAIRVS